MLKNFKRIKYNGNGWIATLIIYLLYLEVKNKCILLKFLRLFMWQPTLGLCLYPSSFTIESLLSLKIVHPFMIIINANSKIGLNCTIYHDVTIGAKYLESQKAPKIGNNIYIGCKSTILGDITIGDYSKIGACSIVLKSTPPNCLITGLYK